jgi:MFS transporter, PAT family, beta-lactamase induction signal transducer AmpG
MAFLAFFVAFFSASQDVVIDAYRTDVTRQEERGVAVAVSVTGYRVAMLVSGAVAMIISQPLGWENTYILMAFLMTIGMCGTFWGPEPERLTTAPKSLAEAVSGPFKNFMSRPTALMFLAMIILYKLGDAFAGSLTTAFLIREKMFTPAEVGVINKGMGLAATLIGALLGGALMAKLGLFRSLLYYGILQAVSNLSFMVLAAFEKSYVLMALAVGIENLSGGMGTAAFVAFLMALCDPRYTATQFALLSAFASLGRVFVGPPSGIIAEQVGWVLFFGITFFAAIPGLILLWIMRQNVKDLEEKGHHVNN